MPKYNNVKRSPFIGDLLLFNRQKSMAILVFTLEILKHLVDLLYEIIVAIRLEYHVYLTVFIVTFAALNYVKLIYGKRASGDVYGIFANHDKLIIFNGAGYVCLLK
jgi:hypothetical protein